MWIREYEMFVSLFTREWLVGHISDDAETVQAH